METWFPFCHRPGLQANKPVATIGSGQCPCSSLPYVVARLRASPCLVRCREHQPSSRKPNRNESTGSPRTLHRSPSSKTSGKSTVLLQSDVVPSLMECGLLWVFTLWSAGVCAVQLSGSRPRERCRNATNGHSVRNARGYELRGKTTCRPTGPSSTRRASKPRTPNIWINSVEFGVTEKFGKTPNNLEELRRIQRNSRTGTARLVVWCCFFRLIHPMREKHFSEDCSCGFCLHRSRWFLKDCS